MTVCCVLYSVNRAGEILQDDAPWAFKLVHLQDELQKQRYFSTASEREQIVISFMYRYVTL